MNSRVNAWMKRFDAMKTSERSLIGLTLLVASGLAWWVYHAEPTSLRVESLQAENERIASETAKSRDVIADIRRRIDEGVHREKQAQLDLLGEQLVELEEQLRRETIELIDPEKMFQLMNQLIYKDSKLKLTSLRRREVRPAIPPREGKQDTTEDGIYRHVIEVEFTGKYLDILDYMQAMEALDWKLLWDEIEISSDEQQKVTVKLVMSTLSTHKQWVGI